MQKIEQFMAPMYTLRSRLGRHLAWRAASKHRDKVNEILCAEGGFECLRAEADFADLQDRYLPREEYGYDPLSLFKRASRRTNLLLSLEGMHAPGMRGLDLGAGDGMLAVLLNAFGHNVTMSDLQDWRAKPALALPFVQADCCDHLPFPDHSFDFVTSYNSFEHFPHPQRAFDEVLRVTRPGGLLHFEFNPLYCSPWGLHAYRMLRMPYPQFLFSPGFITTKLREIGIWDLGKEQCELQILNRWKPSQFESLWEKSQLRIVSCQWQTDESHLDILLEYPECFRGRDLSLRDITCSGVVVTLKKLC